MVTYTLKFPAPGKMGLCFPATCLVNPPIPCFDVFAICIIDGAAYLRDPSTFRSTVGAMRRMS